MTASLLFVNFFGFDLTEVLLHIFNLFILLIGIRFLLYKPIKKIIENRKNQYEEAEKTKNQMLKESEDWKNNYNALIEQARQEEIDIKKEAVKNAEEEGQTIIDRAKKEAAQIIEKANRDVKTEKQKMKEELAHTVPELAVNIASKMLQRELTQSDNDRFIDSIVEKWKER